MKKFLLVLCLTLAASAAEAQWQTPVGTIPVGRGPGVQGFTTVTGSGGTGAQCLKDTNPPTFGTCPTPLGGTGTDGYALTSNGAAASTFQGFRGYQALVGDTRGWQAKAQDTFSVLDYAKGHGCVADDTADCGPAINAAIQAAFNYTIGNTVAGVGATVYLPQGPNCYLSNSTINLLKNISIRGDGKGSCIHFPATVTTGILLNYISGFGQPTISDLHLLGAGSALGQTAIKIPGTTSWLEPVYGLNIRNATIFSFDTAISLRTGATNWLTNSFIQDVNHCVDLIGWTFINKIQGLECVTSPTAGSTGVRQLAATYAVGGTLVPEGTEINLSQMAGFETGFDIQGAGFFVLTNSDISATKDAIKTGATIFGGLYINNNYLALTGSTSHAGIYLQGTNTRANQVNIYSNTFIADASTGSVGIQVNDPGLNGNTNIHISKNNSLLFLGRDVLVYGTNGINIEDNWFGSTGAVDSINLAAAIGGISLVTNNKTAKSIVTDPTDLINGAVRKSNNLVNGVKEPATWAVETNAATAGQVMVSGGGGVQPTGVSKSTTVNGQTCTLGATCTVALGGTAGGDLTGTYPNPTLLTTVLGTPGTFGSATSCVTVTSNAKGLTTAISAASCTPAIGSITGLGTGVATALAINVGSVGAPVVNGGVLGSPSSIGTLPAYILGGTISGGGNQINNVVIGTSTPLAGTFTTLMAGGGGQVTTIGPGGTGALSGQININGSNATAQGAKLIFQKNSGGASDNWFFGHVSAIEASGTSTDLEYFNQVTGVRTIQLVQADDSVKFAAQVFHPAMASDTGLTDNTVCIQSGGTGKLLKGTGALGVCLGTSSARYKHDIVSMGAGLAEIVKLEPKNFYYKAGYGDSGTRQQYGFIAEDVVGVLPGLVPLDAEGKPNSVDMLAMVPILVNAVKELQARLAKLEERK